MASRSLLFSPPRRLFDEEDLFSSPPVANNVATNFKDLFADSPPQTRVPQIGSPILLPDDEASRDSGIFMSDDSSSGSPNSISRTPVARDLSFRSFFTSPDGISKTSESEPVTPVARVLSFKSSFFMSPDETPKASESCTTRRTLFGSDADDDSITSSPSYFTTPPKATKCGGLRKTLFADDETNTTTCITRRSLFRDDKISTKLESSVNATPVTRTKKSNKRTLHESNFSPLQPTKKSKIDVQGSIKEAFDKESACSDLIGDFSRSHHLPTVPGKHKDLKSISPHMVNDIVSGNTSLETDVQIIDCRYPYEFVGGHIVGAMNLHTQDQISAFLQDEFDGPRNKDIILIFHCEFSSERGPKRARFLRSQDRLLNAESYPSLCFPEIYVMDGGYKAFYQQFPTSCTPEGYTPMLQPEHRDDLKKFRSKSKSWSAEEKRRSNYKRSQLSQPDLEY